MKKLRLKGKILKLLYGDYRVYFFEKKQRKNIQKRGFVYFSATFSAFKIQLLIKKRAAIIHSPLKALFNAKFLRARLNRIPDLSVLLFDHVGSVVDLEGSEDI